MENTIIVEKQQYSWIEWVLLTWAPDQERLHYAYKIDFVVTMRYSAGNGEHSLEWRMNLGHYFGYSHNYGGKLPELKFYLGEMEGLLAGLAEAFIRGQQGGEKLSEDMVLNHVKFTRVKVYGFKRMRSAVAAIDYDQAVQQWRAGRKRLADFLQERVLAKQRENAKLMS